MQLTIFLFATLKEAAGQSSLKLTLPGTGATVDDVRRALMADRPALAQRLPSAVAAVNQEFAFAHDAVHEGDEVAFFPPVSGGGSPYVEICRLADAPIDLNELSAAITTVDTGAVCVFSGMVRGQTQISGETAETQRLEYEAYGPMAEAKMRQIVGEIRERWPLVQGIALVQRVGLLKVGENTIIVACASGHRDQGCFEGARYGIDRLKEIVPVWKKDVRPDGSVWIEGHYLPSVHDRSASGAE